MDGTWNTSFVTPAASTSANPTRVVPDPNYHQPWVNESSRSALRQPVSPVSGDRRHRLRLPRIQGIGLRSSRPNGIYNGQRAFQGYKNVVAERRSNSLTNNIWNWPVYKCARDRSPSKQSAEVPAPVSSYTLGLSASGRHVAAERPGVVHPVDPRSRSTGGLLSNDNRTASNGNGLDIYGGRPEQHRMDAADRPRQLCVVPRAVTTHDLSVSHTLPERAGTRDR